jgi:hypothetical protein
MISIAKLFSQEAAEFIGDRQIEPSPIARRFFHLRAC